MELISLFFANLSGLAVTGRCLSGRANRARAPTCTKCSGACIANTHYELTRTAACGACKLTNGGAWARCGAWDLTLSLSLVAVVWACPQRLYAAGFCLYHNHKKVLRRLFHRPPFLACCERGALVLHGQHGHRRAWVLMTLTLLCSQVCSEVTLAHGVVRWRSGFQLVGVWRRFSGLPAGENIPSS